MITRNFKISTLFDVYGSKTTNLDDLNYEYGVGKYPYVTTQAINNGVAGFYNYYTEQGNVLVADSAVLGFVTYQEEKFTASDHVEILKPKFKMNKYIALFLTTILNKENYRYSYGRKFNQTNIKNTIVKLPAIKNNNNEYEPDWQYMEDYIKEKYNKIEKQFKTKNSNDYKKINKDNWQEFKIGGAKGLFNIKLSKGDLKIDDCLKGPIPLISSGDTNNGNVGFIDEEGDGKAEIFPKDTITVDMFGKAYYQPENYFAVSHGRVNILIPKFKINKAIGLFIVAIINNEKYRFEYGRAVYSNVISDMVIKLPSKQKTDGTYEPDWQYMEDYIKSLPYGDLI